MTRLFTRQAGVSFGVLSLLNKRMYKWTQEAKVRLIRASEKLLAKEIEGKPCH